MKRKIAILSVVAIALSLLAYGTVAYFSAEGTAHNVLTMGNVRIALADKTIVGGEEKDFNEVYPNGMPVMPTAEASKVVYVVNNGDNPCYVRVSVEKTAKGANEQPLDTDYVTLDFDTENWLLGDDGYWYYKEEVPAGGHHRRPRREDVEARRGEMRRLRRLRRRLPEEMPDAPLKGARQGGIRLIRKAFKMKLYPGFEAEYEKRHNELWPEMRDMIHEYGGHNYSIFLDRETLTLFGVIEVEDEARWDASADTAICRKWWDYMADIMETNPDNSPVSIDLHPVFHLD